MRSTPASPSAVQTAPADSRRRGDLHPVDNTNRRDCELSRSERIGFWLYVAMGSICVAILDAAAISAIVS